MIYNLYNNSLEILKIKYSKIYLSILYQLILRTLHARQSKIASTCFSPSGNGLITVFLDGSVYFWNLSTFEIETKASLGCEAKSFTMATSLESK